MLLEFNSGSSRVSVNTDYINGIIEQKNGCKINDNSGNVYYLNESYDEIMELLGVKRSGSLETSSSVEEGLPHD